MLSTRRKLGRLPSRSLVSRGVASAISVFVVGPVSGQTVGPEVVLRDSTLSGFVGEFVSAFEPTATYAAWTDTRTEGGSGGDIYVQKLGADGQPAWGANGLAICTAADRQSLPSVTPDGTGGAVVVWLDTRASPDAIFAQRVSAAGAVQWEPDGVVVGIVRSEQPQPFVHPAAGGGFLVTWWDSTSFVVSEDRFVLLAQKLGTDGARLWDPGPPDGTDIWGPGIEVLDGVMRCRSVPDGAGGVIVFGKIIEGGGFRFQRLSSEQSLAWPAPVDFVAALPNTVAFNFAPDGAGGVVLTYLTTAGIRAIRVTGDGAMPWNEAASTIVGSNFVASQPPVITGDDRGGAFVAWTSNLPRDVHVQHVAAQGNHLWPLEGAIVPDGTSSERNPALVSDGAGGIFLSFDTSSSLRAQRLDPTGTAQWRSNGSNGLNLMNGDAPIIGNGSSGPSVVYLRSFGLSARRIDVPVPTTFYLTNIVFRANQPVQMRLVGGVPQKTYDILRTTAVGISPGGPGWSIVGTIQTDQTWSDPSPPLPTGVYVAGEQTP